MRVWDGKATVYVVTLCSGLFVILTRGGEDLLLVSPKARADLNPGDALLHRARVVKSDIS